jgi:hypothetical protein
MRRLVTPEILDSLPSCNIDAQASRRDLRLINKLMSNQSWIRRSLRKSVDDTEAHYCEIGAGDGSLAHYLFKIVPPAAYSAIDLVGAPEGWPTAATWQGADLLRNADYTGATHLIANLILHHFEADQLDYIGQQIQNSSVHTIIACEPCRRKLHQAQLGAGRLIGFNHVTLHDGHVSVEAGFRAAELPELLGLQPSEWHWTISETFMGAYRMVAKRK